MSDAIKRFEFETELGARIKVWPAPEHLGSGIMLSLAMVDPWDSRYAEVFLSDDNRAALKAML